MKKYFNNDYTCAMHPQILQRLIDTNHEHSVGYGDDDYCQRAREKIRQVCAAPDADVHFVVGGTQANAIVIASILRPYQGVLTAETGHIATHETGAIEATGHKVITLPSADGKVTAKQVNDCLAQYDADPVQCHIPAPAMLYISQPTEMGTVYSFAELEALSTLCKQWQIPFFIDGARLGYAVDSDGIKKIAALCDVFYIGGTKCGAAFGEAIVITNPAYQKDFRHMIKRQGGLLAKGRLLGIQFDALFTNNLYFEAGKNAAKYALAIRQAFEQKGLNAIIDSPTNQQFFMLTPAWLNQLSEKYVLADFGKQADGKHLVRICTSWATEQANVDALIADIAAL